MCSISPSPYTPQVICCARHDERWVGWYVGAIKYIMDSEAKCGESATLYWGSTAICWNILHPHPDTPQTTMFHRTIVKPIPSLRHSEEVGCIPNSLASSTPAKIEPVRAGTGSGGRSQCSQCPLVKGQLVTSRSW